MSALSVFKPVEPQEKAEPLSAAALLGAATKKTTKSTSHLIYTGTGTEAAARWLVLGRQAEEIERELALLRDAILSVVAPWHEETCARRRAHESTVEITTPAGTVRVSFQHRYGKLPLDREAGLRAAVNDDFDRYFKRSVSLKVKKEVAEDPTRLEQMVLALAKTLGAENFAAMFEVEQSLAPTKVFTESSWQLLPRRRRLWQPRASSKSWRWRPSNPMPRVSVSNRPRGSFLENPMKEQLIRLARRLRRASIRLQQLDDMSGDAW